MIVQRLVFAVCVPLMVAAAASAQNYRFNSIADTSGDFGSFGIQAFGNPAINNSGTVAFYAKLDTGAEGIYTSKGHSTTTVVDNTGLFFTFGRLSINESGTVAFEGQYRGRAGGIFAGNGAITTITDSFFADGSAINNEGTVAFTDRLEIGGRGIIIGNGGPTTVIADTSGPFSAFGDFPSIKDDGTLVFLASLDNGGEAVVTSSPGAPASAMTVVDTSGQFSRFPLAYTPSINAHGTVAFRADLDAGGTGVYIADGGTITSIADSSGQFNSFGSPSINSSGTVAFRGFLPDRVVGIFTGNAPVADKVIQTGDTLFGSTLIDFGFLGGLNDRGEIAFRYGLANGTEGIAVARLVPEPGSPLLLAISVMMLFVRRTKWRYS